MRTIYKRYGKIVEITEVQKSPRKIRVSAPRERRTVYGARRQDNIRRTRKICVRRVLAALTTCGNPLLVTLTFAGDASDAAYANDSLRFFQMRLRIKYRKALSLFIPELSPKGRIHFHGLLFNVPLSLGDTRKGRRTLSYGEERKTRTLAKLWGEGYVDAVKTDGSGALAHYISKYITKGAGEIMFNAMRLLRISHGFPHEIIFRGSVAEGLARRYASKKPLREWSGENDFAGKVIRKTYEADSE
ncbi:MAG: hypothetical protein V4436_02485 [Patescibacteria group bacterium]